jgi:hypothetical protein
MTGSVGSVENGVLNINIYPKDTQKPNTNTGNTSASVNAAIDAAHAPNGSTGSTGQNYNGQYFIHANGVPVHPNLLHSPLYAAIAWQFTPEQLQTLNSKHGWPNGYPVDWVFPSSEPPQETKETVEIELQRPLSNDPKTIEQIFKEVAEIVTAKGLDGLSGVIDSYTAHPENYGVDVFIFDKETDSWIKDEPSDFQSWITTEQAAKIIVAVATGTVGPSLCLYLVSEASQHLPDVQLLPEAPLAADWGIQTYECINGQCTEVI